MFLLFAYILKAHISLGESENGNKNSFSVSKYSRVLEKSFYLECLFVLCFYLLSYFTKKSKAIGKCQIFSFCFKIFTFSHS